MNVSRFPFGPGSPEEAKPRTVSPAPAAASAAAPQRLATILGRAHHPSLADPLRAELELRLDQRQQLAPGRHAGRERRQHLGERDERDVGGHQAGLERQLGGVEVAGVAALDHLDPRVVAQAPVELAAGDVERDHPRRAALEQAVGEAAGRSADVEAVAARRVDAERVERVRELDPAARDEGRRLGEQQLGVLGDQLARA